MRSAISLAVPVTVVAVILAQTALVSVWIGRQADKLDTVVDTTKRIEGQIYTQSDASKDLALVRSEIGDVRRRVEGLENAQHRQVAQERGADFLTRAGRWLSGGKH